MADDFKVTVMKTFEELRSDAEELFADFFSEFAEFGSRRVRRTDVRIEKSKDELVIEIDVPGTPKEAVKVHAGQRSLRIEWTPRGKKEKQERAFALSRRADLSSIAATVQDGLLTVKVKALPPPAEGEEREVPVG